VAKKLRRAKLRPGARVIVRVTKGGSVGTHTRFKVRAGKAPARRDRCLPPGTKRPVRCVS
jgi:hypothetical protein